MTLDLNFTLKGLPNNGTPGPEGPKASRVLAEELMAASKGDAIKQHEQAMKLAECGKLELDESDREGLEKFVRANENLRTIAKGPILLAIVKLK